MTAARSGGDACVPFSPLTLAVTAAPLTATGGMTACGVASLMMARFALQSKAPRLWAAQNADAVQQAVYDDTQALFAGIDKLASAKSLNDAVAIQGDLLRAQGEVVAARAKAATEYLGKLVTEGAKTAQDNFAKVASYAKPL